MKIRYQQTEDYVLPQAVPTKLTEPRLKAQSSYTRKKNIENVDTNYQNFHSVLCLSEHNEMRYSFLSKQASGENRKQKTENQTTSKDENLMGYK